MTEKDRIKALEDRLANVRRALANFIAWTAQSSGSPISINDARELIKQLDGDE